MRSHAVIAAAVLLFGVPGFAAAHPLTDLRFDRTVAVRLSPAGIEVTYTLELSPFALHLDAAKRLTPEDIAKLDKTAKGLASAYARRAAGELLEAFKIRVAGKTLPLSVEAIDITITDHAICRYTLLTAWPEGGPEITVTIQDQTFAEQPGILNLTVDRKGGTDRSLQLVDVDEPPIRVRTQHSAKLSPADVELSRNASALVLLPFAVAPMPRFRLEDSRPPEIGVPVLAEVIPEPVVNADMPPATDLFTDLSRRGLLALFDSTLGVGILLLAAFLFGAGHAFTPGHGKTLVAAYLVGERGTVRHACILAVATTVAHTGSVIAVAAVLWGVYGNTVPAHAQGVMQLLAGLLVIAVGLWLLLRRVTGQADHFHLFAGHHHHDHDHSHEHSHHHHHAPRPDAAKTTMGWTRLVLMGLGGGLVPCWDAVLLLVAASAMGRLGFAFPLLLAFSAGLGVVLVLLGIAVVYAHRAGETRFKDNRIFQALPVLSAVALVGIGFWLCRQAVGMFEQ
jgi:ABC-type nickel/cobalt efflux system permease component RcnA